MSLVTTIIDSFQTYYKTFPSHEMHTLKYDHTLRVVENAQAIIASESTTLSPIAQEAAIAAAWLHDIGRFEQFTKYQTFSDLHSVDHALYSCAISLQQGLLDTCTPKQRRLILVAIEYHNKRNLPDYLTDEEVAVAAVVRDADKLDIFTLLDRAIETDYLPHHPDIYWHLPFRAPPSEGIVRAIESGQTINYNQITSFCDFVFIQIGWMCNDLYYDASRHLTVQRNEIQIREDYLISLLPDYVPLIRRCTTAARNALLKG